MEAFGILFFTLRAYHLYVDGYFVYKVSLNIEKYKNSLATLPVNYSLSLM